MSTQMRIGRPEWRGLALAAALVLAGCASVPEVSLNDDPHPIEHNVVAAAEQEAGLRAEPSAVVPPPSPPPDAPQSHRVVVLFKSGTAGYAEVAAQIAATLPSDRYRVARVDIRAADAAESLAALRVHTELVAVAVGLEAVELARAELGDSPLVFCQVFNYENLLGAGDPVWGVHSVPPLPLQLRSWKAVDASLQRIGLIVSEPQTTLIQDAARAAGLIQAEIDYEVSSSDRETLYLFKRLAPDIDGLWLFPDNRILSPALLEELLDYALSHDVGVLVFNKELLPWGALLSVNGTAADVARGVRAVLERVISGQTQGLPAMTPLSEVEVQVNAPVARQLGITGASPLPWVLRGE